MGTIQQQLAKYLVIAVLALLAIIGMGGYFAFNAIKSLKFDASVWQDNYIQTTQQIRSLKLDLSDFKTVSGIHFDSIMKVAKIKPTHVTNYIENKQVYNYSDTTITKIVKRDDSTYAFLDTIGCIKIKGLVSTKDSIPAVSITSKTYESNSYYIFHNERKSYKFLFWTWNLFGKRENKLTVKSDCGENTVTNLEIRK
jgi:hypothetical protein